MVLGGADDKIAIHNGEAGVNEYSHLPGNIMTSISDNTLVRKIISILTW